MSGAVSEAQRERLLAVAALVFALSLIVGARDLEDSLLSDAVGAGGVPQGVGIAMALAAAALLIKSFRPATAAAQSDDEDKGRPSQWHIVTRTAALVAILVGYGLLLPWLGYALTVSLLFLASGWLAGAPLKAPLLLCAALAGPLLWALFDRALQVRMPVGSLW